MKLWIFIGRMQPLHLWHQSIIEKSLEENDLTFIILWSKWIQDTDRNTFSDAERELFLKTFLKKKTRNKVLFLEDNKSEENWVRALAILIQKTWDEYVKATLSRLLWWKNINADDIDIWTQNFRNTLEQVKFYCWDKEKDYAINIIKKYESLLNYENIVYTELNRKDLVIDNNWEEFFVSSTRVREELENKNYELLEKMLDRKILSIIKKL